MAKRTTLLHQRDECNQGIRDLGVLPQEAYEKYKGAEPGKVCYPFPAVLMVAPQETSQGARSVEEIQWRQQESL